MSAVMFGMYRKSTKKKTGIVLIVIWAIVVTMECVSTQISATAAGEADSGERTTYATVENIRTLPLELSGDSAEGKQDDPWTIPASDNGKTKPMPLSVSAKVTPENLGMFGFSNDKDSKTDKKDDPATILAQNNGEEMQTEIPQLSGNISYEEKFTQAVLSLTGSKANTTSPLPKVATSQVWNDGKKASSEAPNDIDGKRDLATSGGWKDGKHSVETFKLGKEDKHDAVTFKVWKDGKNDAATSEVWKDGKRAIDTSKIWKDGKRNAEASGVWRDGKHDTDETSDIWKDGKQDAETSGVWKDDKHNTETSGVWKDDKHKTETSGVWKDDKQDAETSGVWKADKHNTETSGVWKDDKHKTETSGVWNDGKHDAEASVGGKENASSPELTHSENTSEKPARRNLTQEELYRCTGPKTCSPSSKGVDINCRLVGMAGNVDWQNPGDKCRRYIEWYIQLPRYDHGIVLEPVFMDDIYTMEVYHPGRRGYTITIVKANEPHLVRSSYAKISLFLQQGKHALPVPTRITFKYSSHPINQMPVRKRAKPLVIVGVMSEVLHDCSPPRTVPEPLLCDKVQQCVGGEDEPLDCPYRSPGCGYWTPLGDNRCLAILFLDKPKEKDAANFMTAEDACKSASGARLADLPRLEEQKLVADVVFRSGRLRAGVAVGLRKVVTTSDKLSRLYRFIWQWGGQGGPVAHLESRLQRSGLQYYCAELDVSGWKHRIQGSKCLLLDVDGIVCMKTNPLLSLSPGNGNVRGGVTFRPATRLPPPRRIITKNCSDGSLALNFHPCPLDNKDVGSHWSDGNLPLFPCAFGPGVHYSLVCDGKDDCVDKSDETACKAQRTTHDALYVCRNFETVHASLECNTKVDCFDGSDESRCAGCKGELVSPEFGCLPYNYTWMMDTSCDYFHMRENDVIVPWDEDDRPLSSIVEPDGFGMSFTSPLNAGESCPETHFQCTDSQCIPTYMLNNGEQDCLQGEDENIPDDQLICPGFYRCYGSGSCVHADYVCDGIYHCPNKDDERYCDLDCPENCTCEGHAFTCRQMFDPHMYLQVRYLDLSGLINPPLDEVHVMPTLVFLNLSSCGLTSVALSGMPLLKVLDLSFNSFQEFGSIQLEELTGLTHLNLSGTFLAKQLTDSFTSFTERAGLTNLQILGLSATGIEKIGPRVFSQMKALTNLDIRNNPLVAFDKELFRGLKELKVVHVDDPRLCCDQFYPDTEISECSAPQDELSSCSDLLRSLVFRVFLWTFSVLAVIGNSGVLVYRLCLEREGTSLPYRLLVINLCLSDLVMGVYMAIIGTADDYYRGDYVSRETEWKESGICKMAGFLAFVSSEVSAFSICLVTLDRFLVVRFPFSVHLRLTKFTALLTCGATWVLGVILGALPFLHTSWQFYGVNSICLPLPVTRRRFGGRQFAFGVFIVLNFVLFVLIGVGQSLLFRQIRSSSKAATQDRQQQEVAIARRLRSIVLTDFCCWFPIGLLGLLAAAGIPIPDEVNVAMAIFVLPLNSAINPFLYTLSTLLERRDQRRMAERVEKMRKKLLAELRTWPREKVEHLVRTVFRDILVDGDLQWLRAGGKKNEGEVSDELAESKVATDRASGALNTRE